MFAQGVGRLFVPMRGEIVEDDHAAWRDLRDQHLADVGGEGRTVHCALDDPRSDQCILGQARDQGLRSPASKRGVHRQPFAARGPTTQAGEVCFHRGFINKDNAFR